MTQGTVTGHPRCVFASLRPCVIPFSPELRPRAPRVRLHDPRHPLLLPDADRALSGRALLVHGAAARRHRHPGSDPARGRRRRRDRRRDHGPRASGWRRSGVGPPGRDPRRAPRHHPRRHDQQGVRLGAQGGDAPPAGGQGAGGVGAGGMEAMSAPPHYVYGMRGGIKAGDQSLVDGMIRDGLWDSFGNVHMGSYAEYTAQKAGVTRAEQDEFALRSHQKAGAAREAGRSQAEIVPVEVAGKGGVTRVDKDEGPRKDTTLEALAKLKPAFQKDGTVTAGNAPGLTEGASALVVSSLAFAKAHGLAPVARVPGYATGGGEPKDLFFAPIVAVQSLLAKTGAAIKDYELIEANEAFAVQAIADGRALGWDR